MGKVDNYRKNLKELKDWDQYLLEESGLPGPRANLELVEAVVEEGREEIFIKYLLNDSRKAPFGTVHEFLALCGAAGLGKLVCEGRKEYLSTLRTLASDERWRIREGVAMALQRFGEVRMNELLLEISEWSKGSFLEKRAAVAALCEPKLLNNSEVVKRVLEILDSITESLLKECNRKDEDFKVLRKTLGYGWSVAAVHDMEDGKRFMEKWFLCEDKDIKWIMKENLKKERLVRKDMEWTRHWKLIFGIKHEGE
jgi:hypothetical protein